MPPRRKAAWLAEKIEASRRAAKPAACSRCGAGVLAGESDDAQAWLANVDPYPADPVSEAVARAGGRMSYDAVPRRRETHLYARSIEHMRRATRAYPVFLDHECKPGRVASTPAVTPEPIQGGLF